MTGSFSFYILFGYKAGFKKKMLKGFEELSVEVKYIVNKMLS